MQRIKGEQCRPAFLPDKGERLDGCRNGLPAGMVTPGPRASNGEGFLGQATIRSGFAVGHGRPQMATAGQATIKLPGKPEPKHSQKSIIPTLPMHGPLAPTLMPRRCEPGTDEPEMITQSRTLVPDVQVCTCARRQASPAPAYKSYKAVNTLRLFNGFAGDLSSWLISCLFWVHID
jgi:hypothetical protein